MIYADSSFTASLYALDENTKQANAVYQKDRRRPLLFSDWQELELINTLRLGLHRAHRSGTPAKYQIGNCLKRMQEDLAGGILRRVELNWPACVRRADSLSNRFTVPLGIVMLDIWHLACAIELGADTFWTFDNDQEKLARQCGQFRIVAGLAT